MVKTNNAILWSGYFLSITTIVGPIILIGKKLISFKFLKKDDLNMTYIFSYLLTNTISGAT